MGFWKVTAKIVFAVSGWKLASRMPPGVTQAVMVAAPHTSNWDLIYARGAFYLMDLPVRFTVKKEWVDHWLLGWLVKSVGGLGVDRSKNNSLVDAMVSLFRQYDPLIMLITPEGTRKYQPKWRKGFYYTALEAGVPIALGFLDYARKEAGVGPLFYPTGDYEKDLEEIKAFYRTKPAVFPTRAFGKKAGPALVVTFAGQEARCRKLPESAHPRAQARFSSANEPYSGYRRGRFYR